MQIIDTNKPTTIGQLIRNKRIQLRYKVKEIAQQCGIDVSKYSKIENDKVQPSEQELLVIIDTLDLDKFNAYLAARMLPAQVVLAAFKAFKQQGFKLVDTLEEQYELQKLQQNN